MTADPQSAKDLVVNGLLAVLYAIAAISGALGGCAASCYYMTHDKAPRWAFAVAYTVVGCVFGVVTFAGLALLHPPASIHLLVLYSLGGGAAGAVALGSANLTVRILLRHLGVEVAVTMRKAGEERRDGEG